jgi:hypothetical protein
MPVAHIRKLRYNICGGNDMETITRVPFEIPFYTQKVTESTYKEMGFANMQDAAFWAGRCCGIASLRMVVDGIRAKRGEKSCGSLGRIIHLGLERGAYLWKDDIGWIHRGLTDIAAEYGVHGETARGITAEEVAAEIESGHPCIVSVTVCFAGGEYWKGEPLTPGGHLVVALGTVREDGKLTGFICHHPGSLEWINAPECKVSLERFEASFSGNTMIFYE